MNDVQAFLDFDEGAFHLRGSSWQQRAAAILHQYLEALPDVSQNHPALLNADGQTTSNAVTQTGL
jgi:hypothetical protein